MSSELMVEHLAKWSKREIVEKTRESRARGAEIHVMCQVRLPVKRHARMIGVELPRMEIEDGRVSPSLGGPHVGSGQPIGINAEVRAATRRKASSGDPAD